MRTLRTFRRSKPFGPPPAGELVRGRPVLQAYTDTGALDVSCSHCGASPGQWCSTDGGRTRRVPCVVRAAAGVGAGDGRPYARDFSEPTKGSTL